MISDNMYSSSILDNSTIATASSGVTSILFGHVVALWYRGVLVQHGCPTMEQGAAKVPTVVLVGSGVAVEVVLW
jgi:predicted solute-binding protein